MHIVDSQVHIWGANSADRPWPADGAHRAQKPYPVTKDMRLAEMDAAGVSRVVIVPPRGRATATIWRSRPRACIPSASR
jgi:predicted TIM-barrel fold metal-dependent hydrolase